MTDPNPAAELVAACEREVRSLVDHANPAARKRLLVLTHVVAMVERGLASGVPGAGDADLVAAIR